MKWSGKRAMVPLAALLMLAFAPLLSCLATGGDALAFQPLSEQTSTMTMPQDLTITTERHRNVPTQTSAVSSFASYTKYAGLLEDNAQDIAVDENGSIYVVGRTASIDLLSDLGISSALQIARSGVSDGYLIKFNDTGVVYGTYFGGSTGDSIEGVAIDSEGRVWIVGYTASDNSTFPISGNINFPAVTPAYDDMINEGTQSGHWDGFLAVINKNGTTLEYSTYLGGLSNDKAYDIVLDGDDNAWVVGETWSTSFPMEGNPLNGTKSPGDENSDGFLACLNDSSGISYSTFICGAGDEQIHSLVMKNATESLALGSVTVGIVGLTESFDFNLTLSCYDNIKGTLADWVFLEHTTEVISDIPTGLRDYTTYIGGGIDIESPSWGKPAIAYDTVTNAYVLAGEVPGDEFSATGRAPQLSHGGGEDMFVFWMDPASTGSADALAATFWGGSGNDRVGDVIVDVYGHTIVVGWSTSTNFPLVGWRAEGLRAGSSGNMAIVRFDPPALQGTHTNLSTLHYVGRVWEELWACDLDTNGYDLIAFGEGHIGLAGDRDLYVCKYTMPTEPYLTIAGSNIPSRTGHTIRVTGEITEGNELSGAAISHVYLSLWYGDDESASVYATVPDSKAPDLYEAVMQVNRSGEYTWTFTPYTLNGGRARKQGTFNVTGATIGGVISLSEADILPPDPTWGENGIGWYVVIIGMVIGLFILGFVVAKGERWGYIPILSALGGVGTVLFITMPFFWWQIAAMLGIVGVCTAVAPLYGLRGFTLSLTAIFVALFASSLYLAGITEGWTIGMLIGAVAAVIASIPGLSKAKKAIGGLVGTITAAIVSGVVAGVF